MPPCPKLQPLDLRADDKSVEPVGCEPEFRICWQHIGALDQPTPAGPDRHATMPSRVSEERDQIHLGVEGKADRIEVQPQLTSLIIRDPGWLVGEDSPAAGQRQP